MVKIALQIRANLENVETILPAPSPDFRWYLKFACNNCGEVSNKWNYVSLSEEISAPRGNAVNHFVNKCKLCSRENSLAILEDSIKGITDGNEFKTVIVFDCRGLEPKEFSARDGWWVKTEDGGTTFTDVDLGSGDWADYCEKTNKPVSVSDIEHRFEKVK